MKLISYILHAGPTRDLAYLNKAHALMLKMAGLHLVVCTVIAAYTNTWGLVLAIGLPSLVVPWWVAKKYPTALISKMTMAAAFMVFTGLIIQQVRGDLEGHFSYFVMLAGLVVYCDWRPLVFATILILIHHLVFALLQPLGCGIYVFNDVLTNGLNSGLAYRRTMFGHFWVHVFVGAIQTIAQIYAAGMLRKMISTSYMVSDTALEIAKGNLEVKFDPQDEKQSEMLSAVHSMQQQLILHRDHLNSLVTERTHELNQAREIAENATEELKHQKFALDKHAIVAVTDVEGRITYANEKFSGISGYTQEELIGKDHALLNSGYHPKCFFKDMYRTIASGNVWHDEVRNCAKDGSLYWVEVTIAPFLGEDGVPQSYIAICTDISERKQAENELKVAATAFESQEGILVTDANSIILRVNHAFTIITGYSTEEVVGKTPQLLSSRLQDKAFYTAMWTSLNNTGAWEGEIWNRRKNGEVYPEHLTITAVKDKTGIVINYVATFTDITMSKAASEEIQNLAFYDALTHLPNRRLLLDRLNQALAASARDGHHGALLFLDLDHFKTLNDSLGHDVGDMLLQQVGTRLTACVREDDSISRLGGDEFVVLLENLSEHEIEAAAQTKVVAEKILLSLNQPYQLNMHTHHSTPSIGATLFNGHNQTTDELLKQADISMYQSKSEGRNTLRFFDPKMQEAIAIRVDLENELRKAIEQNQFQLYYQIQVDSHGQALGAEALIRWLHPERGMISPFKFIPLAEETGFILPIGQWVLDTACAQLKTWQQNPLTQDLVLAVNVSAKQFHQEDFVEKVKATLQRYEINPGHLKFELTESMLVNNINDIITKMDALSKIGVFFSLDDFGTGYSSLQYLKKLPLNQLKIDQSFVRDIVTDSSDRAIVRTIITMAHSLAKTMNVIAEGVETAEQRQYLLDNGCTHFQGYLFSRPVPIEQFEALLGKADSHGMIII